MTKFFKDRIYLRESYVLSKTSTEICLLGIQEGNSVDGIICKRTSGHIEMKVDLKGKRTLRQIYTDVGDSFPNPFMKIHSSTKRRRFWLHRRMERKMDFDQESKNGRVLCTCEDSFMNKTIMDNSIAASASPCIMTSFQMPQVSSVTPVFSIIPTPTLTNMNIADSTKRLKSRSMTATPLAGCSGTTAQVLVGASMVKEYNSLKEGLESVNRITRNLESFVGLWI